MLQAAAAWSSLADELGSAADSFGAVTTGLTSQAWQGPAAAAMTEAAAPYRAFLRAASTRALTASTGAKAVAEVFEACKSAMVHPEVISANRRAMVQAVRTNFFGFNAPFIAAAEAAYEEFWATDVAAMVGYHGGASAVAAQLSSWQQTLKSLPGIGQLLGGAGGVAPAAPGDPNFGIGNKGGGLNLGNGNTGNNNFGNGNKGDSNVGGGNTGNNNIGSGNRGFGVGGTGRGNWGFGNLGNDNIGMGNRGNPATSSNPGANFGLGNFGNGNFGLGNHGDLNVGPATPATATSGSGSPATNWSVSAAPTTTRRPARSTSTTHLPTATSASGTPAPVTSASSTPVTATSASSTQASTHLPIPNLATSKASASATPASGTSASVTPARETSALGTSAN